MKMQKLQERALRFVLKDSISDYETLQGRCWFFSYIFIEKYGSGNLQDSKRNGS